MRKINVKKIQRKNDRKAEAELFKEDAKYGRKYAMLRAQIRSEEKYGKGVTFLYQCLGYLGWGLILLLLAALFSLVS